MAGWGQALKDRRAAADYEAAAARVAISFATRFWYPEGGYLYDVIDGPDGVLDIEGRRVDASLRPNQIFAVSLGTSLLDPVHARAVVDVCAAELLTPVGLRSLAPSDPHYAGHYMGDSRQRDGTYHQGTVWSWLLGPFALAHHAVYGDPEQALALLEGLANHLDEGCIGSVSEIMDGDAPHAPRGCFAQAWGVSETLRAYRWGEDGIAGFSDREQRLCFALALWNGRDPILKERLFGLTNGEGNHGEDVKELYYYLDATPTHSYLKMLYKYPQAEYPYGRLVEENRRRGIGQPEFELVDSGLFEANRYFDVFVEYAQAEPGDVLIQVTVENRGPEAASIHLLPQLWFRNTWSWKADAARPVLTQSAPRVIRAEHPDLGVYHLHADGDPTELLFCDNESNNQRLWNQPRTAGFFKDGFNDRVVHRDTTVVNPAQCGTKAAPWYTREVPTSGQSTPRSQSRVGAFEQCRHHLDAGQMGIPLVRSLGPRLSLHSARGSRRRICQGAARAPDARVVHAPERAATRLRVGLRGRQSTGACLGHVARVPDRPQATRGPGRPGIPGARVPQADAELHLVGQPQGCGGP